MSIIPAPRTEAAVPEELDIVDDDPLIPEIVDGVLDITDRRRVLLHVVFGIDAPPGSVDEVFDPTTED